MTCSRVVGNIAGCSLREKVVDSPISPTFVFDGGKFKSNLIQGANIHLLCTFFFFYMVA